MFGKKDLRFSIKDKVMIGHPSNEDLETEGIAKLILKNFNEYPDFVVQVNVQTGEKTTFAQMKDRSVRCALWLKKQGITKDDVVCTSIPLHNDDYVPCLATLFIGAIFNSWCNRLTLLEARYFFNLIQPKIMFAWDEEIDLLNAAARDTGINCKFVVVGKHPDYPSLNDLMAEQTQQEVDEFRHVEPENPKKQVGAIFFSSGTTGKQKGAILSYEILARNRCYHMIPRNNMNILLYSTFAWITGFVFFTLCIRLRLTRILHSKFAPEETSAVIEKFKVNLAVLTPTMLCQLCKSNVLKKYDFSQLENIFLAGAKPNIAILEAAKKDLPNTFISNAYGITEAGGLLTFQTENYDKPQSVGRVVGDMQLKVIDPKSGCTLGANQVGELCFKLYNVMFGYFKNEEETKEVMDDEGWLHTGDLGFYDENGEITVTDRMKRIIIIQTTHVSPSQIEDILLQHPSVADAAVVPIPHSVDIERPLAFVLKKPGAEVTADELKKLPASYSELFLLTGGVIFIDEIPYTSNGKKSIKVLTEMARNCDLVC